MCHSQIGIGIHTDNTKEPIKLNAPIPYYAAKNPIIEVFDQIEVATFFKKIPEYKYPREEHRMFLADQKDNRIHLMSFKGAVIEVWPCDNEMIACGRYNVIHTQYWSEDNEFVEIYVTIPKKKQGLGVDS